ncbi:MAG: transcription termination/antitermination protein NusG [Candidatus Daviesbacteria bacterium]|nr:transcription termination/antitermination protein NusG [Candidatus Daviesbacteria bacterium]
MDDNKQKTKPTKTIDNGKMEDSTLKMEGGKSEQDDQSSTIKVQSSTVDLPSSKNDNPDARWYVVHTYSGHENKVALTLKQRVESEHLEEKILDVLVPTQEKIEIKSGKKVNVKEKIFPGYILVKMVLDDASWLAVRTTQGVTSFVGMGNKPTPISDSEVATIVKFTQTEAPMYKQVFAVSDAVKIVDGPFADFIGKIDSVDGEKGKVRVLVSIFGRETPVELDFLQIKKI